MTAQPGPPQDPQPHQKKHILLHKCLTGPIRPDSCGLTFRFLPQISKLAASVTQIYVNKYNFVTSSIFVRRNT